MKEEKETKLKKIGGIMLTLLTMLTLTSSIQPNALAQKTSIVIGWSHPTSGPTAGTCAVHHLYYKMIIDDYNAKGGLNVPGYGMLPITYIEYDDKYDPALSLANLEHLINVDKVDLLFAPWSTAFCVQALGLFEQYKYPVVGLTVSSNTLSNYLKTGVYKYFFVTLGQPWEDALEVRDLFTYINEQHPDMPISRVGFAYRADEHGIEHAEAMKDELTAMGIEVPVSEPYDWMSPPADWTPFIGAFSSAAVDAVIFCGYTEGATFVRQCITQDYNPKMLMVGPAMETPFLVYDVWGFTPGQMAGIAYYNGFPATAYNTPELKAWVAHHVEYTKAHMGFGYKPFPASGVFYAGLECLFKAVEEHGLDREAIRDALETETFDTLVGTFKFRKGQSPAVANHGTLTQWHGKEMMDVIWPLSAASEPIIYPKYPWSWTPPDETLIEDIIHPEILTHDVIAFKLLEPVLPGDVITPGPFEIIKPWSLQWSNTYGGYGHSQFAQPIGDIDEDGVNEIIVGGYESLGNGRARILSYAEAMSTYREEYSWTYMGGDANSPSGACVVDLDDDGDLEFVMSWTYSGADGIYAYDWDGTTLTTLDVYTGVGFDFAYDVYACDYDDDGYVEVLIANAPWHAGGYHVTALGWNRAYGRFTEEAFWRLSGYEGTMECPMIWSGETDNDGKTEVIACISDSYSSTAGTWALNWNPALVKWTEEPVYTGLIGGGTHYGVTAGDVNGNGIPEIGIGNYVEGYYGAAACLIEWNTVTHTYEKVWEGSWPEEECIIEAVAIGDADNDGTNEFYAGGGNVHIISWDGTKYVKETIIAETSGLLSGVNIGDCDNDGLNELKACDILDLGPGNEWIFKDEANARTCNMYHIENVTWFYWIDDCPYAMFAHDTRYVFIDNATGEYVVEVEKWWPLLNGVELWATSEEYWNKDNWVYSTYTGGLPAASIDMNNPLFAQVESNSAPADNPLSQSKKRSLIIEGPDDRSYFARNAAENWRKILIENFSYSDSEIIYLRPEKDRPYINGTSTVANVNETIKALSLELNSGDNLWVFIVAHGYSDQQCNGYVLLQGMEFRDKELAQLLNQINASITVLIDSCYSGSFIEDLCQCPQVKIIVTSTDWKSECYKASDGLDPPKDWEMVENMTDPNIEDEGGEFSSGFIIGLEELAPAFNGGQITQGELYCRAFYTAKEKDAGYIYRDTLIAKYQNNSEYGPYPLLKNKIFVGDLNADGEVDIFDVVIMAQAFGSTPGSPNWNPVADIDCNVTVDIFDVVTMVNNFSIRYF